MPIHPNIKYSKFPLLQLPSKTIQNVLSILSPFELIDVSKSSTRVKRIVKEFTRTQRKGCYTLSVVANIVASVFIEKKDGRLYEQKYDPRTYYSPHDMTIYGDTEIKIRSIYSNDPVNEWIICAEYYMDILNCQINFFRLNLDTFQEHNQTIKHMMDMLLETPFQKSI
ncbi:F-box domain-containing protein [Caenorhabditis elegans]|uniref:F-box domain-containing protein n=1 Tax=Caenorhabditis elegans TaxID=6239 RepID=Q9U2Z8_CAEEL|nr:F-box domain-containing protein [Caenorhabditis elegans]CAB63339.2 F-box domain-containing protein [Caenorhabditis elegans]